MSSTHRPALSHIYLYPTYSVRMITTKWLWLAGSSGSPCPSTAPAEPHRSRPSPMGRRLCESSKEETTQPLGSLCQGSSTAKHSSAAWWAEGTAVLWVVPSAGASGAAEKSLGPFSLHPPFRYWWALMGSSWTFSSWTALVLSVSPHRRGAPIPSASWWDCARFLCYHCVWMNGCSHYHFAP